MFESIYKKRKNPIFNFFGWFLLGLVCLIFIFVGYSPDVSFLGSGGAVAKVNGDSITMAQFNQTFDRAQGERKKRLSQKERVQLQKEVIDSLVNRSLILQEAEKEGVMVSPREIADYLMQIPAFQEEGKFSLLKYKELINSRPGLTEARFEERILTDLLVQKMYDFYLMTTKDGKMLEDHEDNIGMVKFNLNFIKVPKNNLVSDAEITPETIAKFLKDSSSRVNNYYKENIKKEFTVKEQVKAQHILIKTSKEMTEEKALKKIQGIQKQINDKNFGELAKKYSEDPGSKTRNGDLGFFTKGRMVPAFEAKAFSLKVGEVSEPVKTSFGYHIIKVTDKKEPSTKELDEVKDQIARQLIKEDRTDTAMEDLEKALSGGEKSFADMVGKKKWKWEETGLFGLGDNSIPKMGPSDDIMEAMVNLSKESPLYQKPVEKNGMLFIVKLKSVGETADKTKPQIQGMDFFKQFMERQKTTEMFQAWMSHLKKDASIKINNNILN